MQKAGHDGGRNARAHRGLAAAIAKTIAPIARPCSGQELGTENRGESDDERQNHRLEIAPAGAQPAAAGQTRRASTMRPRSRFCVSIVVAPGQRQSTIARSAARPTPTGRM